MIVQLSNVHYIQQSIVVEMSDEFKISVALLSESLMECPGLPQEVRLVTRLSGNTTAWFFGNSGGP